MKEEEYHEQCALFEYAELISHKIPQWGLLFAIPLGGLRHTVVGKKLKLSGTKAGIPDLMLPVARGRYHGLFLELKTKTGRLSKDQERWIETLENEGYCVRVCYGFQEAKDLIENYLVLEPESEMIHSQVLK